LREDVEEFLLYEGGGKEGGRGKRFEPEAEE
jgi:hypothetical protein